MNGASLNRILVSVCAMARDCGKPLADFSPHDLGRTASTLLHEAGYNTDWIEKCLAHEQKGVRAVYNKAEYAVQRRTMLQEWADMIDAWTNCHDNAVAETFFQRLKRERIKRKTDAIRNDARQDIFDYIEMFYNPKRRHGFNDRLSPAEFERRYFERLAGV